MDNKLYDYWVATLQNGYIGNLIKITECLGGAKSLYELIKMHKNGGDTEKYLYKTTDENVKVMLTKALCDYMASKLYSTDIIEHKYLNMLKNGINYVNYSDNDFPTKLLNIPSPPYGLFVKGNLPDENIKSVAVVGSRECSEYGRDCAQYFGAKLAEKGIQVISGMAWGIDGISQMEAIKSGGKSYGVLGCGVDVIYPIKNSGLYNMLCENGNGVISEYDINTKACSRLFPPRNRIIAGLCDLLLVIEARAKSGTLITVNMAMEQGKSIMAVPGRITDELSRGCLMLIGEGAIPAVSIDSILDELGLDLKKDNSYLEDKHNLDILDNEQREIYSILSYDPMSSDTIADKCKISINEVLINLSKLELMGYVKEVMQGKFVINS